MEDTEGDLTVRRRPFEALDLESCKRLLRREGEVERASAVGRHREADVQMKNYVSTFGSVLNMRLPALPTGTTLAPPSLPLHAAANFQRAVAKEKRNQAGSAASQPLAGATEVGLE